VLQRMPEIGEVIEIPFQHGELKIGPRWHIGRSLRERRYLEAIVLPNSFKAALIPFFADIPLRVGFIGEFRYGLLNVMHRLDERKTPLMAERYLQLAEMPGESISMPSEEPRLSVDLANLTRVLNTIGLDRRKPVAVFCPGAEYGTAKRWPTRHFAELAKHLASRGTAVWLMGSKGDSPTGEQIASESGGAALNLCGKTDLASAIDLMSVADLVVSNDSGLMHVAAALARPLIALYGSTSPAHTPPLGHSAHIVGMEGLACRPCYQRECPLGHFRCMNELAPERVLAEISRIETIGRGGP